MNHKLVRLFCSVVCCTSVLACVKFSTDGVLNGDFLTSQADNSAPQIIFPTQATVTDLSINLSWSVVAGAKTYTLVISTDPGLANPLVNTTIKHPVNSYSFTAADSTTHYWKVYADSTRATVSTYRFEPTDAIYVSQDSTSTETPVGTKNKPYKNITDGMAAGVATGKIIKVAVSSSAYSEDVIVINKAKLYGGYNKSTWARDLLANETTILPASVLGVLISGVSSDTVLDGFTIRATSVFPGGRAVTAEKSSAHMVVSNNKIYAAAYGAGIDSVALRCDNAGNITIKHNAIVGTGNASNGIGIFNYYAAPTIINNTIYGATTSGSAYGIYNFESLPFVSYNIIFNDSIGANRNGYWENDVDSDPQLLAFNLIYNANILYKNEGAVNINDTGADGILNGPPNNELNAVAYCGASTCSYNNISATAGFGTVFTGTFNSTDAKTWTIKASGPADRDSSGGFSNGDIGANISSQGGN